MKARLPQGYGKQNPNELMKQVQQMQDAVAQKQAELEEAEYTVSAAGGMVDVVIRGDYNISSVSIKPDIVDPEDVEMLEDMVAAAFNEAVRTVKETSEREMEEVSGQFNIPNIPGMSL